MATSIGEVIGGPADSTRTESRSRALGIVMIGTFMTILDTFIVVVAAPAMKDDLHASTGQLRWTLVGYQLSCALALIPRRTAR